MGPVGVKAEEPGLCHLLSTNIKIVVNIPIFFPLKTHLLPEPQSLHLTLTTPLSHSHLHVLFSSQSIEQLEKEMLNGQKLQGPSQPGSCSVLQHKGMVDK